MSSSPDDIPTLVARLRAVLEAGGDPPDALEVRRRDDAPRRVTVTVVGSRCGVHLLGFGDVQGNTEAHACRLAWRKVVKLLTKRAERTRRAAEPAAAALAAAEAFR